MGILQARIQEWVVIPSSRGSFQPRYQTQVSRIAGGFFTVWATIKIMEWVAYPFSRGTSRPRNGTGVSCIAGGFFTSWATREALSSHRHAQLLTQFLAPSLSGKLGETAENSRLLIMDWSFWLLVPTQSPSRSPLRVTSVEQKMRLVLLSLRYL